MATTKSPCTNNCSPNADICPGCKRTWREVAQWNGYTDEQKIKINERLEEEK